MAPSQQPDETIRSTDSSLHGQASSTSSRGTPKKVKAYVDFSEYNRNYDAYMTEHGLDPNDDRPLSVIMKEVEEKAKAAKEAIASSQSSEEWVVLSDEHVDPSKWFTLSYTNFISNSLQLRIKSGLQQDASLKLRFSWVRFDCMHK